MNKDKAGKLLGKFWEDFRYHDELGEAIYFIDFFILWLYDEGFEIYPREFVSTVVDKED